MKMRPKRHVISLLVFGLGITMIGSVSIGNERCNIVVAQPVSSNLLSQTRPAYITLQAEFSVALEKTLTNRIPSGATVGNDLMAAMIADYVDTDGIPKKLNVPSVEMVPMISQIVIDNAAFSPKTVKSTRLGGDPPHPVTVYSLQLFGSAPTGTGGSGPVLVPIYVELVWPFKYHQARLVKPTFTVDVQAYVQLHMNHANKTTTSFHDRSQCFPLTQMLQMTVLGSYTWNKTITTAADCYFSVPGVLQADKAAVTKDIIDTDGNLFNGFVLGQEFSVSVIVFAQVKRASDGVVVDRVPQVIPFPGALGLSEDAEFSVTPKLFFQTFPRKVQATMPLAPLDYEWTSLEVADLRFNYSASNWVKSNETPANYVGVNPSTTALLGQEGRDADIFMSVSDAGYLQSPGELGFIIRPFPYVADTVSWDFRSATEPKDKDYMFRTIRLYDHGSPTDLVQRARDLVYENFTSKNPDGTMTGARVNPRSDLPQMLLSAVQDTPVDYYWYYWVKKISEGHTPVLFSKTLDLASWCSFTNGWLSCLQHAKAAPPFNICLASKLSDVYGRHDLFGWYSNGDPYTVFAGGYMSPGVPANLTAPLHEIDRKMLYSYSLDNFKEPGPYLIYYLR